MKTHNEYPAEVGTLISCFGIMNTDLRFLTDVPEIKKKVELQLGPFASFALRKIATAIQKYIVPWSIATIFGLSFPKMQTIKTYREMHILQTRIELHESEPDIFFCRERARLRSLQPASPPK